MNAIPNITETKDKENLNYTEETDDTEKTDDGPGIFFPDSRRIIWAGRF